MDNEPRTTGQEVAELLDALSQAVEARGNEVVLAALAELLPHCQSCGVKLVPGAWGNVALCDLHDETCDRCDADLVHEHGRAV